MGAALKRCAVKSSIHDNGRGNRKCAVRTVRLALLIAFGGALQGHTNGYNGGFNPVSARKCLWESMVCVGMSLGLIAAFRRGFNTQGPVLRFLSPSAFAVYLFHPPFVIAFAHLMHGLAVPPLAKAVLLTVAAATTAFVAGGFVFRRLPLLKAVL